MWAVAFALTLHSLPSGASNGGSANLVVRVAGGARNDGIRHAAREPANPRETTSDGFTIATAPYEYRWPRDQAAHPGYQTEWWYYTGHLRAKGRRFGFELTFFRIGLRPGDPRPAAGQSRWRGHELYPAHFAITDEQGQTFFHEERVAREALGMGSASTQGLDVKSGAWYVRGAPLPGRPDLERMTLHASASTERGTDALELVAVPLKRPAVHGERGVSRKAACPSCASHYYSYTRLQANGTLVFDGVRYPVEGMAWMDHEFGSGELQPDQAGWDWFSIQLDDGRELMLYQLREKDGSVTPQSSGSLVARDGSVRHLPLAGFTIEAVGRWTSPHTSAEYPSAWHVRVPSAGIDLALRPAVADQELAETSGTSYWEGAVGVFDAARPAVRLGSGYVELTGYASPISL